MTDMTIPPPFTLRFTATAGDIDQLGHVNNAVWVQWMESLSVTHWNSVAPEADRAAYIWMVTRHEIDYRGNIGVGESVTGKTWIDEPPRGARFNRNIAFITDAGKEVVRARTAWAMMDAATGRVQRVPAHLVTLFMGPGSAS